MNNNNNKNDSPAPARAGRVSVVSRVASFSLLRYGTPASFPWNFCISVIRGSLCVSWCRRFLRVTSPSGRFFAVSAFDVYFREFYSPLRLASKVQRFSVTSSRRWLRGQCRYRNRLHLPLLTKRVLPWCRTHRSTRRSITV